MKILQLISSAGYFGAENVLMQLAAELNKDNSCYVVAGVIKNLKNPHVEIVEESAKKGVESAIFSCGGKWDFKTIFQLRKFVKEEKIELIHSHGYKSNLYAFFSTIGLSVALVATCHNWLGDDPKMRFYAALDRFFLRKFSQIIAVSVDVQNKIIQSNISRGKVSLIKNGVNVNRFDDVECSPKFKATLGIPEHRMVIGTVGRISSEKGHLHLLNVFNIIQKKIPEITLLIVGDGNLREKLQREFDSQLIVFTGQRSDLPNLYKCMDIFVLPSLTEGLPMVLLEAMASSLPVVATKVGFVPNVILEKETGLLVEPGDEEGLWNCLVALLADPEKRIGMGLKGYERVKNHFSASRMAKEYLAVYSKAVGGAG